jgi:hypothetical protein
LARVGISFILDFGIIVLDGAIWHQAGNKFAGLGVKDLPRIPVDNYSFLDF